MSAAGGAAGTSGESAGSGAEPDTPVHSGHGAEPSPAAKVERPSTLSVAVPDAQPLAAPAWRTVPAPELPAPSTTPTLRITPIGEAPKLPKREPGASEMSKLAARRRERRKAMEEKRAAARAAERASAPRRSESTSDIPTMRIPLSEPSGGEPDPAAALIPAPVHHLFEVDRPSTDAQRAGFARRAGSAFEEALPSVRTALATFPSLRAAQTREASSDFVAVHLYLGAGEFGANRVNSALRGGRTAEFADGAACLLSGLRRLPVHRGPVFRLLDRDALGAYEAGMVVTEPGFVSASSAQGVVAGGAAPDFANVLLWSHSARRTSAFDRHGLPDEVVFPAGSRFLVLAADPEAPGRPALLLRELRPDEGSAAEPDASDHALLARMRRALERHHRAAPNPVTGDALQRITAPIGLIPGELRSTTPR